MTELVTDAQNRALRTFIQGLATDLALALATVLYTWVGAADLTSRAAWIGVGILGTKTALTTVAAYVMRRWADPSGLPTPLPPPNAGPPNEDQPPE